ncbi:hypothetical protein QEZ54_32530 [Catellatospora sp. KI3]|uniref:hypothetical protein n=1 Tax=Catellatospora sp. KI3 TaxID=3041620 RepID=UPI0024823A77|nr:hypothetical protein [Catellatospora sp. KI3]MDI1465709.1 hypothetical protein [Catellatospora sp. KI3]
MNTPEPAAGPSTLPRRLKRMSKAPLVRIAVTTFSAIALVVGFANDMFGLLADDPPPPASATALDLERKALLLAQEWPFQKSMSLRDPASGGTDATRIGWSSMLSIANTSATPIVVNDVETVFPQVSGAELRRVDRANAVTVYADRGDWITVNEIKDDQERADARFKRSQPLPLILQPGRRILIEYEQAFEFWLGGTRQTFATTDDEQLVRAVAVLVPMRQLAEDQLQCPFGERFDTVVRTANGEIHKPVRYVLLVAGCAVIIRDDDRARMLDEDDPLGDGFPDLEPTP